MYLNLTFDNKLLNTSSLGALFIISGVLMVDNGLDNYGSKNEIGSLLFILGWLLITYSFNNASTNDLITFKNIYPMLVFGAAFAAQKTIQWDIPSRMNYIMAAAMSFVATWYLFAYKISEKKTSVKSKKIKQFMAYGGATSIIASMAILMMQRRYDFINQNWNGKSNVFNPGLVLFTLGWAGIVGSLSIK